MEPNTVHIDRSGNAPLFTFADSFNVSVHMIDRHLNEGRSGRMAYVTDDEEVTYAQLAERVNRAGNGILAAGLTQWLPTSSRFIRIILLVSMISTLR